MSITILLEIGQVASLRSKTTPEGFTHDWEVFVKGFNGADIHYYVEKVVFHLHETFPKPKRVVKEPPYSLRTSGYAGFNLPVEIYLRNNQDPKKIKFNYDLQLQPTGPPLHRLQKEKYTFFNPSEEFKSKLLKGGAVVGSGSNFLDNSDSSKVDEKSQMTSKPKMSGTEYVATKKHRFKPEEPRNTDFENIFGHPYKKTSKAPEQPKPKEVPKSSSSTEKNTDKDKTEKSKTKSPHKDKEKEKTKDKPPENFEKRKDEKKKSKDDKSKDRDKAKEKSSKKDKDKEREKSPAHRPKSPSPKRSPKRVPSPVPVQKHSSNSKEKEQNKDEKKDKDRDKDRGKEEKKSKKDKREHKDSKHREKDREKEHKEHKSRDSKSAKEKELTNHKVKDASPVTVPPPVASQSSVSSHKSEKRVKEKEHPKDVAPPKEEEKPEKNREETVEEKQKHRHKKKDRKEKREDKHSKSEKRAEKQPVIVAKEVAKEPPVVSSSRDTDKSNLFGSPHSDSPSTPKEPEMKVENTHIQSRDEDSSNESGKISSRENSPVPKVVSPASLPSPMITEPVKKAEPEDKKEESQKKKERKEKKKDKRSDKDHERKRKRKSDQSITDPDQPQPKLLKENNNSEDESKVSSTKDTKTEIMMPPKNECDMDMLKDLQHKIMSLKDNADLQKVVQLIAETGQYEVSAHTFDFDLCLLDRSTVRQLQEFFTTI